MALAGLALAVGLVDVLAPHLFRTHFAGPTWAVALVWGVSAVALAWRRVAPFAVLVVVAGLMAGQDLVWGPSSGNGSLLPLLVASYSVAVHAPRRAAYAALAVTVGVVVFRELRDPAVVSWPTLRSELVWDLAPAVAWLAGSWVRDRRLYEAGLLERTAHAEQARAQTALAAVAEERARIARELHDSIAHSLTAIVVQAEAAEDALDRDPQAARAPLGNVIATGRAALGEMRSVVGALRDPFGADDRSSSPPGRPGIEDLVASAGRAGLSARLSVAGTWDTVPAGVDQAAYRVVQEALTNVMKHSRAGSVVVDVDCGSDDVVAVDVYDPGPVRPEPAVAGGGHGLMGLRERVALFGGSFEAGPMAGGGFRVHAAIPIGAAPSGTIPSGTIPSGMPT